ncbi:F-box protein At4g00755-like [Tasmannia lanceolata]|uniref:F-box protein At4g00755-like n=1 Tax=Tasmannia lanceolata TaxID=3420 RepID=UPI0040634D1C
MESCGDFLHLLGDDVSMEVFMCLDDPSDIARASSVSHSWRRFVIANSFCKKLCIKKFPEIVCFTHVTDTSNSMEPIDVGASNSIEWECQERDHRLYARLSRALTSGMKMKDCIVKAISASSTDDYEDESIENTLYPSDRVDGRPSYWSSEGTTNPEVSHTLTYRLNSKLCVVDGINIQPFQAFFQFQRPVYSAQAVRFNMGYSKSLPGPASRIMDEIPAVQRSTDDDFIWTYVSSKFPMTQENHLQTFKLPQPVLCIGGILQIELLGMVQQQEINGLYYACVRHVQVIGRPLSRAFDVGALDFPRKCELKYLADAGDEDESISPRMAAGSGTTGWCGFAARFRQIKQIRAGRIWNRAIRNMWHGNLGDGEDGESDG